MHQIPKKPKRIRYKGRKAKLIHLDPKVFEALTEVAKFKNMNLKNYIEELCILQLKFEVKTVIEQTKYNVE